MSEPKYLVVVNRGTGRDRVFYMGDSEIHARKRLKELKFVNKELVRATVKMTMFHGYEFLEKYEVIEKIA